MPFPPISPDGRCSECNRLRFVGDWPQCPHAPALADPYRTLTHQDSIPGGLVLENYGPHPVTVYSHTERKMLMERQGLQLREKFSPAPGTDVDPQGIPNPKGYVDEQTLKNGAELILRAQKAQKNDDFDPKKVITNRTTHTLTDEEARTIATLIEKVG